jgi:hypothetical protein
LNSNLTHSSLLSQAHLYSRHKQASRPHPREQHLLPKPPLGNPPPRPPNQVPADVHVHEQSKQSSRKRTLSFAKRSYTTPAPSSPRNRNPCPPSLAGGAGKDGYPRTNGRIAPKSAQGLAGNQSPLHRARHRLRYGSRRVSEGYLRRSGPRASGRTKVAGEGVGARVSRWGW